MKFSNKFTLGTRLVAICLLVQMCLSWKLWWSAARVFPCVPFFGYVDFLIPIILDQAICLGLIISLIALLFLPNSKRVLALVLSCSIVLILFDITRLQVWFYQLNFILLILYFRQQKNESIVLISLQLSICFVYFWSGLHKMNIYFAEDTFPWFLEKTVILKSLGAKPIAAYLAALFELSIAIFLLLTKTRKFAIYLVLIFHLFILLILGPFGHNWNQVVWPWNVLMIALVFLFFKHEDNQLFKNITNNIKRFYPLALVLLLFGLMPLFNRWAVWDEQLSFKMYAGTNPEGTLYFANTDDKCFDKHLDSLVFAYQTKRIVLDDWALAEMNAVPYTNKRTTRTIAKKFCKCFENSDIGGLEYLSVDPFTKKKEHVERIPCSDLLK